jgi:hypothetical protein
MTITTEAQPASKPEVGLSEVLIKDVSRYVDGLDSALDDLVRALEAFDDEDIPASVSELAASMLREAEEVRYTFDSGDLSGQVNELEALAEAEADNTD